jgi:hypothetical protein
VHVETTPRLPIFLQVTPECLLLGGNLVVLQNVIAGPVQVSPRVEERMHVLVHCRHAIRLGPVILDAE